MANVLVVHSELPLHDRASGSLRLFRIAELLSVEGHEVTFHARAGLGQDRYRSELEALGIAVNAADPDWLAERGLAAPTGARRFPELLAEGRFDVAIVFFHDVAEHYVPLIRAHSPLTRVVVDSVDIHHVRERREAELRGDAAGLAAADRTRDREAAVYGAADALVAVSEEERAELERLAPGVPAFVVSNVHDPVPAGPGFDERSGVLFVGNFNHRPNVDAILDFHASSWPLVRERVAGAKLTVVGTDPPPAVQALAGPDVEVTGWVEETRPYLDAARVSVAPLRYGAGVKGKIGEALSHGLPVVTTSIGAEGMGLADGEHARVLDAPEELAVAVAELHEERGEWERLAHAGRGHVEERLGRPAARRALGELLDAALPAQFVAQAPAGPDELDALLGGYVEAFGEDDAVSLALLAGPGGSAGCYGAVAAALARLGRDPERIPDLLVVDEAVVPASARRVERGEGAEAWRSRRAGPRSRAPRRESRAAVLLRLSGHGDEAAAQIGALAVAGVPDDVEVLIAVAGADEAAEQALAGASGARILRSAVPVGRTVAARRAAEVTRARVVVTLEPGALARPGFLEPLVESVEQGAALAGPVVDGAHGLWLAPDGSLWPVSDDHGEAPTALPLDCLAARREDWLAAPIASLREGFAEAQLAAWASPRGPLAVVPAARVDRMAGPPVSVVVCTRNRAAELEVGIALLAALGATSGGNEVVILDNASTDGTGELARELAARHPGVKVAFEAEPGLCHARNASADAARHDLLLYVDDDARPSPGWLSALSRALARPGVVNAGGPIAALWPPSRPEGWPDPGLEALLSVLDLGESDRELVPPELVYGANWAVRRDAMRAVGGFDPAFGPSPDARINGDEVSVARRLHAARAGTTRYVAQAAVGHRIAEDRVDDRFMTERSFCVGVERPRQDAAIDGVERGRLLEAANAAAARLLAIAPLSGEHSVESAFDAIAAAGGPLRSRAMATDALGELAACVSLLGEQVVEAGPLRLRTSPENLRGVLAPRPPLAQAA